MKIFAFSTDDGGLEVFRRKENAIVYCEGVDVENGEWVFWDEKSVNLKAKFSEPNINGLFFVSSGKYDLISFPEGLGLQQFLSNVAYVEDRGMFSDIGEIRRQLTRV